MKKPAPTLVAALLLSAGVACAGEVAKTATSQPPAEKPAPAAVKPAETTQAHAQTGKAHHRKSHAHKAMAGDGSVKPAEGTATAPKAPETPKK